MCGSPVHGNPNDHARILLIGQAPGPHEAGFGKPFAYTAGKTLFKWLFEATGENEETLRDKIYFSAVARCFPGKNASGGGDREPDEEEIKNCRIFLAGEVAIIQPQIVLAVGKLAIREVLGPEIFKKTTSLTDVIGKRFFVNFHGHPVTVVPLPHPSGISTWHKKEPGLGLLKLALKHVRQLSA